MNTTPQETKIQSVQSINPATGQTIASYQYESEAEVIHKIEQARKAQQIWKEYSTSSRKRALYPVKDYLLRNADYLARQIAQDTGKTITDALATEVLPAEIAFNYYTSNAKRFLKPKKLRSSAWVLAYKRSKLYYRPFGVIGIISPWNYPFSIPFSEVIMALMAGNAVVLKVATETMHTGSLISECLSKADLPEGLFQYVKLPGRTAGDTFLSGGVDKLFFTGSVAVGKILMEKAAKTLTPVSLELGGNDPMIVLKDADLDRAANGAVWAGIQNAGQSCGGVERIYVEQSVFDSFLSLLKQKVAHLRLEEETEYSNEIGAVTTENQLKTIRTQVEAALKDGAKIAYQHTLASKKNGYFPPTILTNVNHRMRIMKEETFGPVLCVMPFSTEDEAVDLANDSTLGLTASVWSKDRKKAKEIGARIQAGTITINDHLMSHGLAETPWGGFKESGIGRTHGEIGFKEMTEPQVIVDDVIPFLKRQIWWYPFDKKTYNSLLGILQLLYNNNIFARIKSIINIIPVIPKLFKK
ncbi:MAG: aldehyde dehydrogenase family protein [Calditrichia bacterium]